MAIGAARPRRARFAEMVVAAADDKLQELVPWLIERVESADKQVVRIVPTELAGPFFAWAEQETETRDCAGVAPPDGSDQSLVTFVVEGVEAIVAALRAAA